MIKIERGISQRALDKLWLANGGLIEDMYRTGERRYVFPDSGAHSTPYSKRRKDASVKLIAFAKRTFRATAKKKIWPYPHLWNYEERRERGVE